MKYRYKSSGSVPGIRHICKATILMKEGTIDVSLRMGIDLNVCKTFIYKLNSTSTLENGIEAWETRQRPTFDTFSRVQNLAVRIIAEAMKSTVNENIEELTGLKSPHGRRDT